MASIRQTLAVISLLGGLAGIATASTGVDGHGLIGYGIDMYKPICAYACQSAIMNPLNCEGNHGMDDMDGMIMKRVGTTLTKRMDGMGEEEPPTPECYANSDPYLQTLAWCMHTRCEDVQNSTLQKFWETRIGGRLKVPPVPKYSYVEAVIRVAMAPPTTIVPMEEVLNVTSLTSDEDYIANVHGSGGFEVIETSHSRYGLALMASCIMIPIVISCLGRLPFPRHFTSRANALLNYPPLFGLHHRVPLLGLTNVPTRGQSLYLFYIIAINIIFCSVDYQSWQPNSWFSSSRSEIAAYISNRTGALSLVNLAIAVLFAGRNNFLLWVTDWSYDSYLLFHRYIASIATLQACIHSAMYLQEKLAGGTHASESKLPYWIWGVVATLGMSVLLPTSILPVRRKAYEFFLAWHVVLSFFSVLGCYYHIYLRFEKQWGYELWVYVAFAFWGFDRLARFARLAKNGVRMARITVVDDDYVRVDIPGVVGEGHAYLYFPTLTWLIWENHPFSVASGLIGSTAVQTNASAPLSRSGSSSDQISIEVEKQPPHVATSALSHQSSESSNSRFSLESGLTFFVRSHAGLTRRLRDRKMTPVLVESSYGRSLLHTHDLNDHPRLVCLAGGVGITATLPLLAGHHGQRSLYWGIRHASLVDGCRDLLESHSMTGVDVHVSEGKRFDLREVIQREARDERSKNGLAVVISGPESMADEIRRIVAEISGKKGFADITFVEEAYSW